MTQTERPNATSANIAFRTWLISAFLYASACFLPVRQFGAARKPSSDLDFNAVFGPSGAWIGLEVLLQGWMNGNAAIPWSANAILLAASLCLLGKRYSIAASFAVVAALLGLVSWLDYHIPGNALVGSYVWEASMIVLAIGAARAAARRRCHAESELIVYRRR
jgi:hypothetical protein